MSLCNLLKTATTKNQKIKSIKKTEQDCEAHVDIDSCPKKKTVSDGLSRFLTNPFYF